MEPRQLAVLFLELFQITYALGQYRLLSTLFFIPQSNMFRLKVTGHTQSLLFDRLYYLYIKGIPCLLLSFTSDGLLR